MFPVEIHRLISSLALVENNKGEARVGNPIARVLETRT